MTIQDQYKTLLALAFDMAIELTIQHDYTRTVGNIVAFDSDELDDQVVLFNQETGEDTAIFLANITALIF